MTEWRTRSAYRRRMARQCCSASGRPLQQQRAEIRALLDFQEPMVTDAEEFGAWLRDYAVALTRDHARPAAPLEEPTPP